jgi:hypothetical protein
MTRAHKDVMRVDRGDRRDVILLTCANGDVGGRQRSAHHSFRISNIVIRLRDPAVLLSKNLSRGLRSEVARDRAERAGQFPCQGKRQENDRGDKQHRRGKAGRIAEQSV